MATLVMEVPYAAIFNETLLETLGFKCFQEASCSWAREDVTSLFCNFLLPLEEEPYTTVYKESFLNKIMRSFMSSARRFGTTMIPVFFVFYFVFCGIFIGLYAHNFVQFINRRRLFHPFTMFPMFYMMMAVQVIWFNLDNPDVKPWIIPVNVVNIFVGVNHVFGEYQDERNRRLEEMRRPVNAAAA